MTLKSLAALLGLVSAAALLTSGPQAAPRVVEVPTGRIMRAERNLVYAAEGKLLS